MWIKSLGLSFSLSSPTIFKDAKTRGDKDSSRQRHIKLSTTVFKKQVQPSAFGASFRLAQISIDSLVLYVSFATFRWKETDRSLVNLSLHSQSISVSIRSRGGKGARLLWCGTYSPRFNLSLHSLKIERMETEIEWHSKCNRLHLTYTSIFGNKEISSQRRSSGLSRAGSGKDS